MNPTETDSPKQFVDEFKKELDKAVEMEVGKSDSLRIVA